MALFAIMKAALLIEERFDFGDGSFTEVVVWLVPAPVPPSSHRFKYRMVYVVDGGRVIGYDNERGKGDHRHVGDDEEAISFGSLEELLRQFRDDVKTFRRQRR
jgi:hypothetical protein